MNNTPSRGERSTKHQKNNSNSMAGSINHKPAANTKATTHLHHPTDHDNDDDGTHRITSPLPPPPPSPPSLHTIKKNPSPKKKKRKKKEVKDVRLDHAKDVLTCGKGGPIKNILYSGTVYYIKDVSNKHIKLNCSTKGCPGTVLALLTNEEGVPTSYLDGGRLHIDKLQYVADKTHLTTCDKNPILVCESHDFLHAMMRDLTMDIKIERDDPKPNSTISYYKERRADWRKPKYNNNKKSKEKWFNDEFRNGETLTIPPILTSRQRERFYNDEGGKKDDELDAIRSLFEVGTRLDMLAAKVDCTGDNRDKIGLPPWVGLCVEQSSNMVSQSITMNVGKLDGQALVPLFIIKANMIASNSEDFFHDVSHDVNGNILVKNKRLSYNCTQVEGVLKVAIPKMVDKDGCRTRVFIDTNNILKNGKDFGYIRVGDCLNDTQLQAAYNLSEKISPKKHPWKMLPFILLACCRFKFNRGKSRKDHLEMKDKWTTLKEKEKLDELILFFREFISDFRQSVVAEFDPSRKKELLEVLARFTW